MVNSHGENIDDRLEAKGLTLVRSVPKITNTVKKLASMLMTYELALCQIIAKQPDSASAEIAKAALRRFGKR
jgi:hypothetical protein